MAPEPSRRVSRGLLAACSLALIAAPFFYFERGLLETEATVFVIQYLHPDDGRGVLQKIFDPQLNDFDLYQARELSYALDLFDARVLGWLLSLGIPCFVAASSAVSALALVGVHRVATARLLPGLAPTTAFLPLLLFLSSWVPFVTSAVYYRSAKPALAPLLLAGAFGLLAERTRAARGKPPRSTRGAAAAALAAFALGLAMALLDRQGFLLLALGFTVAALDWLRGRARPAVALGLLAATLAAVAYDFALGPWLIQRLNGYRPSLAYQDLGLLAITPSHVGKAFGFLAEQVRVFFGGAPLSLLALLGLVLAGSFGAGDARARVRGALEVLRRAARAADPATTGLVAFGLLAMFAVMINRHPYVYDWVDHRLWYYGVPLDVLLLFGSVVALDRGAAALGPRRLRAVEAVLLAMVVVNVASWGRNEQRMLEGPWFPKVHRQSDYLKQSFATGTPHPRLGREHRRLFDWLVAQGFTR
jgi:hypothetical protein